MNRAGVASPATPAINTNNMNKTEDGVLLTPYERARRERHARILEMYKTLRSEQPEYVTNNRIYIAISDEIGMTPNQVRLIVQKNGYEQK